MDPHLACSINQSLFSITLARHLPEKMEEIDGKKSKKKVCCPLPISTMVKRMVRSQSKIQSNTLIIQNDVKDGKEPKLNCNIHVC